jgi:hypothetical protein
MDIELTEPISADLLGHLQDIFLGLTATTEGGKTTLSWMDSGSQKDFLQLLSELDVAGLTIVKAGRRAATLEEVFVHLTSEGETPG